MMREPAALWSFPADTVLLASSPPSSERWSLDVMVSETCCHVTGGETAAAKGYDREEVLGW
jgi:hypothetical protein